MTSPLITAPADATAAALDVDPDPFEDIEDDAAFHPAEARAYYLGRARRGYSELHRDWIQKPRGTEGPRASFLGEFVRNRRNTALEAFLMLHALEPVLRNGEPVPMGIWAALLTTDARLVTPTAASKAFTTLELMRLAARRSAQQHTIIEPLTEDGAGIVWQRPGERDDIGQGYFTLPFAYWQEHFCAELGMAGKAMLLILLSETQIRPSVVIPIERAQEWYGVSERTAERGYNQLTKAGILMTKIQKVTNYKVNGGFSFVYHRALKAPFSTASRQRLQRAAQLAGAGRRGPADTLVDR